MAITLVTIFLVEAVIFVNGWTDAPNAIASVVATKTLPYGRAVGLAAVCNLLGVGVMSLLNASVADTITSMVNFGGSDPRVSLTALCAAMAAIVLFSVGAWFFGIPTSESHGLIAALSGAALAINSTNGINLNEFYKVLGGMAGSSLAGLGLGYGLVWLLRPFAGRLGKGFLRRGQLFSAALMAFVHGAQDGQKFIAVFVIAELLSKGRYNMGPVSLGDHLLVVLLCSATMALGTSVGGRRIIEKVGEEMVPVDLLTGCCSDFAGALCLLGASLLGVPVSTTHTKTSAVLGAGLCQAPAKVKLSVAGEMVTAWLVTFPVCGMIGYLLTRLLLP